MAYVDFRKKFDFLEQPLRTIDSILEKFAKEQSLILKTNNHCWPSRSLEIKRETYKDIFRQIGITLDAPKDIMTVNEKRYIVYASAGESRGSKRNFDPNSRNWLDAYGTSKIIGDPLLPPLNPKEVYQLLIQAYEVAKSFDKQDLKRIP